jgi:hypothetical protein
LGKFWKPTDTHTYPAFVFKHSVPEYVGWIVLVGSGVAGLIVAFFTSRFMKFGVFLVGVWAGGVLATVLFELFVYKIESKSIVLWLMIIGFGLIIGLISLKFLKMVMIIGTSFVGSY